MMDENSVLIYQSG